MTLICQQMVVQIPLVFYAKIIYVAKYGYQLLFHWKFLSFLTYGCCGDYHFISFEPEFPFYFVSKL
jgi:hypothetical protein